MKQQRARRAAGVLSLAMLLTVGAVAGPAQAAASVSVADGEGRAAADPDGGTQVTVSGQGFQSVPGGFGGIYVVFGWVDDPSGGSWRPSQGGVTGEDLRYMPDSESKDNQGYQRFVAFPGSETAGAANGGELTADGSWSTTMVVPPAVFEATDRAGRAATVNCLEVTCGIITLGAHGVKNATNETFTPVTFTSGAARSGQEATGEATEGGAAAPGATAAEDAAGEEAGSEQPEVPATLGVDQTSLVVGRVLGFTGQGFTPGEQVVGALDEGLAAVGPLVAGPHGEVAGVLRLPAEMRLGTHTFTLTGAASGQSPVVEVQVAADPAAAALATTAADGVQGQGPATIAVGVAALVLLGLLVSSFVTARRRRRATVGGGAR